jgi:hypothetical protein
MPDNTDAEPSIAFQTILFFIKKLLKARIDRFAIPKYLFSRLLNNIKLLQILTLSKTPIFSKQNNVFNSKTSIYI